jgi:glycosyltransferase involved in cell wall biosynthesis
MAKKNKKVIVVMPGFNVAKTLKRTVQDIPKGMADEIILVDDGSRDNTSKLGKKLGLTVYRHQKNKGYGGAQKTAYKKALKKGADIIIMIHPDYQYAPHLARELVRPIKNGLVDIMLGTRIRGRKDVLKGGMPFYKYIANRFLTITENIILGLNLSEYHTGYRAFSKKVLETIPFNRFSDDYLFDSQTLISAVYSEFSIGETPVPVRYFPEAGSINFVRAFIYGAGTLIILFEYIFAKLGLSSFEIFAK